MAYFRYFDRVLYDPDNIGKHKAVNIISSVMPKYSPIDRATNFFDYSIQDGERPEDVSYKFYNTTEHHWIIMLMNNVVDPYHDWLLSYNELENYMRDKYGDDLYNVHHFVDLDTNRIIDQYNEIRYRNYIDTGKTLPVNISPVSNREFEIDENEKKRIIKVISPQYIDRIIAQYEDLMLR